MYLPSWLLAPGEILPHIHRLMYPYLDIAAFEVLNRSRYLLLSYLPSTYLYLVSLLSLPVYTFLYLPRYPYHDLSSSAYTSTSTNRPLPNIAQVGHDSSTTTYRYHLLSYLYLTYLDHGS